MLRRREPAWPDLALASGRHHAAVRQEEAGEPPQPRTRPRPPSAPQLSLHRETCRRAPCRTERSSSRLMAPNPGWQGGGGTADSKATGTAAARPTPAAQPGKGAPAKGGPGVPGAKPGMPGAAPGGKAITATGPGAGKKNGPLEALPAFKGALAATEPRARFLCCGAHDARLAPWFGAQTSRQASGKLCSSRSCACAVSPWTSARRATFGTRRSSG